MTTWGDDFPCCATHAAQQAARVWAADLADAMRSGDDQAAEAAAADLYRRAYLGHGDQLAALEAEAYAHDRARRRRWWRRRPLDSAARGAPAR